MDETFSEVLVFFCHTSFECDCLEKNRLRDGYNIYCIFDRNRDEQVIQVNRLLSKI